MSIGRECRGHLCSPIIQIFYAEQRRCPTRFLSVQIVAENKKTEVQITVKTWLQADDNYSMNRDKINLECAGNVIQIMKKYRRGNVK